MLLRNFTRITIIWADSMKIWFSCCISLFQVSYQQRRKYRVSARTVGAWDSSWQSPLLLPSKHLLAPTAEGQYQVASNQTSKTYRTIEPRRPSETRTRLIPTCPLSVLPTPYLSPPAKTFIYSQISRTPQQNRLKAFESPHSSESCAPRRRL